MDHSDDVGCCRCLAVDDHIWPHDVEEYAFVCQVGSRVSDRGPVRESRKGGEEFSFQLVGNGRTGFTMKVSNDLGDIAERISCELESAFLHNLARRAWR